MEKYLKKDKELFCEIRKIIGYTYKAYNYKDLITITYPTREPIMQGGNIFIIFIPGINLLFLIDQLTSQQRKIKLNKKWRIIVKE